MSSYQRCHPSNICHEIDAPQKYISQCSLQQILQFLITSCIKVEILFKNTKKKETQKGKRPNGCPIEHYQIRTLFSNSTKNGGALYFRFKTLEKPFWLVNKQPEKFVMPSFCSVYRTNKVKKGTLTPNIRTKTFPLKLFSYKRTFKP